VGQELLFRLVARERRPHFECDFHLPAAQSTPAQPTSLPVQPSPTTASRAWPITGDDQIDKTHTMLNNLPANRTESQLIDAIRHVFYKRIFIHIYEEPTERALFTFCRAQLLLEAYIGEFSSPDVRVKIGNATQSLISLQDQVAKLYGPTFHRDQQCRNRGATLKDYTSTLPTRQQDLYTEDQTKKALSTLGELRSNLVPINLMDPR
jgi:hypothetical protein